MMKIIRWILLMTGWVLPVSWTNRQIEQADNIPVQGYSLTWRDEFSGVQLDPAKWNCYEGKRKDAFNSKSQAFLDGKGFLHLQARSSGDSIYAAVISTQKKFETRYGYFECRARLTNVMGVWPSFWLQSDRMGADYGTPELNGVEIDIFEYFPNYKKDTVSHNLHWGGYGPGHREIGMVPAPLKNTGSDFHVFGLEWTENSYTTYVDGVKTASTSQSVSKVPEFVILSMEADHRVAGVLDKKMLPVDFVVDYVRVYKKSAR